MSSYKFLFSGKIKNQINKIEAHLESIPLPKFTNEQTLSYEENISEGKVFKSLKSMANEKPPANDRPSKEFYDCFRDEIRKHFLDSIRKTFLNEKLSSFQKQAVIKMLEKRERHEIHSELASITTTKRPISLLNPIQDGTGKKPLYFYQF